MICPQNSAGLRPDILFGAWRVLISAREATGASVYPGACRPGDDTCASGVLLRAGGMVVCETMNAVGASAGANFLVLRVPGFLE
jgi:hypothetical protein